MPCWNVFLSLGPLSLASHLHTLLDVAAPSDFRHCQMACSRSPGLSMHLNRRVLQQQMSLARLPLPPLLPPHFLDSGLDLLRSRGRRADVTVRAVTAHDLWPLATLCTDC